MDQLARLIIEALEDDGAISVELGYEERRLLEQLVERVIDNNRDSLIDEWTEGG